MKLKIIITGAIFCVVTTTSVHAVTKCVALNSSSTTCTSDDSQNTGHPEWDATCTTNGVSTPISGIGVCSSKSGSSIGQTATELATSSTSGANKYCWCKMISPVVSKWVYTYSFANSSDSCPAACSRYLVLHDGFKEALFSNLSD